jgi:ketosteroid isomerase-like protein
MRSRTGAAERHTRVVTREEDVEVVRRLFADAPDFAASVAQGEAFREHPWLSLWHPDCVIEEPAEVPDAAAHRGRDGVMRYFRLAVESWDDVRYTAAEILDGGQGVVTTTDMHARSKAGIDVRMRVFQVFRVRDGMVIYATAFTDRGQALDVAARR